MGLFDKFKSKPLPNNTDNGVPGPSFLEGLTEHISNPQKLHSHEWRRKLKSPSGNSRFRLKFYGKLHEEHRSLIVGTEFAPALVYAVDISSQQEILLFDGCRHGYNAMFCDSYSVEQVNNRVVDQLYKDESGEEVFEIIISTYNGVDYDDEFGDMVDENGLIELVDGKKEKFETVKRNGYDTLQIWGINGKGKTIELVSEELA